MLNVSLVSDNVCASVFTPLKNVLLPTFVNLPLKSDFVTKVSEVLENDHDLHY